MQMMLVLTIFEFFFELRAWDCISHCRENIGCSMDHCYILMPLHLKYLLKQAMCSIYILQPNLMLFWVQLFYTNTRIYTTYNCANKSKKKYHQNTPNVIIVSVIFGNFQYFDDIFYR